jgi:hypothetical protein
MKVRHCITALLFLLLFTSNVQAEEYFGKFSDGPDGRFVDATPRPKFQLLHTFSFDDPNGLIWSVPDGSQVDGASIPQTFWSVIGGPFEGNYIKASVIHDFFCDTKTRTSHDTHRNFYYGMRASGVPEWQAKLMYWAVSTYGPDWTLEKRIVEKSVCSNNLGRLTCTLTPSVETTIVQKTTVDLQNPETLAVALGKFSAVAQTLKTSNGKTLDVLPSGNVDASFASIESNAAQVRELLASRSYRNDPGSLGVVLEPKRIQLDKVENWPANEVPEFSTTPNLSDFREAAGEKNTGFVLQSGDLKAYEQKIDLNTMKFELPAQLNQK